MSTENNSIPDITDPAVRLDVYKKVLDALTTPSDNNYDLDSNDGLCLWLPSVWLNEEWDAKWIDHNGKSFTYWDTTTYFPELRQHYPSDAYQMERPYRISILKEIITQMETNLTTVK